MSCTAIELLTLAKTQIGISEQPPSSNTVKYNTAYYGKKVAGSAYPWCCVFVWWLFDQCNARELFFGGNKTASCSTLMDYAKKNGLWVTSDYKPGDLILYNFNSDSSSEHIGVCESADSTSVTSIEGNTSITSDDNGGSVMRRKRNLNVVLGAYRPKYTASSIEECTKVTLPTLKNGSLGTSVKALQILLNSYGFDCGKADGEIGKLTLSAVKRFQSAKNLTVDGIVGKNTWTKLLS